MAPVRRAALITLAPVALGWAATACAPATGREAAQASRSVGMAARGPSLILSATGTPGSLRIENSGGVPVAIAHAIGVEMLQRGRWTPIETEFNAVAACRPPAAPAPVRIAPGAALDVVPWRGWSCSGQCRNSCRANAYFGPGRFRAVVTTSPNGARVVGPEFAMPAEPVPILPD